MRQITRENRAETDVATALERETTGEPPVQRQSPLGHSAAPPATPGAAAGTPTHVAQLQRAPGQTARQLQRSHGNSYTAQVAGLARQQLGSPLPTAVRTKMEAAFGADFGAVRVHQGPQAAAIGATAFTQGTDIHFTPGSFDPISGSGQALLGHELAHVVQQRAGRVAAPAAAVPINDSPALEAEAETAGARAARGAAAPVADNGGSAPSGGAAPVQRKRPDSETPADKAGRYVARAQPLVVNEEYIKAGRQYERAYQLDPQLNSAHEAATQFGLGGDIQRAAFWHRLVLKSSAAGQRAAEERAQSWAQQARDYLGAQGLEPAAKYMTSPIGAEYRDVRIHPYTGHLVSNQKFRAIESSGDYTAKKARAGAEKASGQAIEQLFSQDAFSAIVNKDQFGYEYVEAERINNQEDMNYWKHRIDLMQTGFDAEDLIEEYKIYIGNGHKLDERTPLLEQIYKYTVQYQETSSERSEYQLHVDNGDGIIKQGSLDEPYSTADLSTNFAGQGYAIFVMDADGGIYADQHRVSQLHHSSFLAAGEVAASGEVKIEAGKLKAITNKSGHYKQTALYLYQALREFTDMLGQTDLGSIEVVLHGTIGSGGWAQSVQFSWPGNAEAFLTDAFIYATEDPVSWEIADFVTFAQDQGRTGFPRPFAAHEQANNPYASATINGDQSGLNGAQSHGLPDEQSAEPLIDLGSNPYANHSDNQAAAQIDLGSNPYANAPVKPAVPSRRPRAPLPFIPPHRQRRQEARRTGMQVLRQIDAEHMQEHPQGNDSGVPNVIVLKQVDTPDSVQREPTRGLRPQNRREPQPGKQRPARPQRPPQLASGQPDSQQPAPVRPAKQPLRPLPRPQATGGGFVLSWRQAAALQRDGLDNVPIRGNGNCLYDTLIHMGAFEGTTQELRNVVAAYLNSMNEEDLELYLRDWDNNRSITREQAVSVINTSGAFQGPAGDMAPELLTLALGIQMHIYNDDGSISRIGNGGAVYPVIRFRSPPHYHATSPSNAQAQANQNQVEANDNPYAGLPVFEANENSYDKLSVLSDESEQRARSGSGPYGVEEIIDLSAYAAPPQLLQPDPVRAAAAKPVAEGVFGRMEAAKTFNAHKSRPQDQVPANPYTSFKGMGYAATPIEVGTPGAVLRGLRYTPQGKQPRSDTYVLVLSGSGGSIGRYTPEIAQHYCKQGATVVAFDYRGFGASDGGVSEAERGPSERGLYEDADAMLNYLLAESVPPENIIIHGFSLGGPIAAELVIRAEQQGLHVRGLVLDRAMASLSMAAKANGPAGKIGAASSKRNVGAFDTKAKLAELAELRQDLPLLVTSAGPEDSLAHGDRLLAQRAFAAGMLNANHVAVPDVDHFASDLVMRAAQPQLSALGGTPAFTWTREKLEGLAGGKTGRSELYKNIVRFVTQYQQLAQTSATDERLDARLAVLEPLKTACANWLMHKEVTKADTDDSATVQRQRVIWRLLDDVTAEIKRLGG